MNRSSKFSVAGVFALAFTLSWLFDPPALGLPAAAAAREGGRSVGCTVKRIEVKTRRLDVIVGVGHALRILTFDLASTCSASTQGRAIAVATVRSGDIVRIQVEPPPATAATPAREVVRKIDLVVPAPTGGAR